MRKILLPIILCPFLSFGQNIITTVAGNGTTGYSGDGGPATSAQINAAAGLLKDGSGNLIFCDALGHNIRKISTSGIISTVAGNGSGGYSGDGGAATAAQMKDPCGVAIDAAGNIIVAEYLNQVIRKITPSGVISTIGGDGIAGYSGDGGPATAARFNGPEGICIDAAGNIYIGDGHNQRIRKINPAGIVTTIAGTGVSGYNGDGIPATAAQLSDPFGVVSDSIGNIFIADQDNNRIRKINTSGIISTVAGTGVAGYSGEGGPATAAQLRGPCGVYLRKKDHSIIIADRYNHIIRKVDSNGIITAFAGTGVAGYSGDGMAATSSKVNLPPSVYADNVGNVYISDYYNSRIRLVSDICISDISSQPLSDTVFEGDNATFSVTTSFAATGYQWQENPGSGFVNLANVWPYSGVLTSSLTINHSSIYSNNTQYRCVVTYETHCPDTSSAATLIIRLPSGVSSVDINEVSISPNPATNRLNIQLSKPYGECQIELFNELGQKVLDQKSQNQMISLDITRLPKGVYVVRLTTSDGTLLRKVTKT
jgi:hypothetical protein